jgi:hypothetical protein
MVLVIDWYQGELCAAKLFGVSLVSHLGVQLGGLRDGYFTTEHKKALYSTLKEKHGGKGKWLS